MSATFTVQLPLFHTFDDGCFMVFHAFVRKDGTDEIEHCDELRFDSGNYLISGMNGAGKSRLMNRLALLEGHYPENADMEKLADLLGKRQGGISLKLPSREKNLNYRELSLEEANDHRTSRFLIHLQNSEPFIGPTLEHQYDFFTRPTAKSVPKGEYISDLMARKWSENLSGGEKPTFCSHMFVKQNLEDPNVVAVFFDEPFANLDKFNQKEIESIWTDHLQDNHICFVVDHHNQEKIQGALKYRIVTCQYQNLDNQKKSFWNLFSRSGKSGVKFHLRYDQTHGFQPYAENGEPLDAKDLEIRDNTSIGVEGNPSKIELTPDLLKTGDLSLSVSMKGFSNRVEIKSFVISHIEKKNDTGSMDQLHETRGEGA